MPRIRELRGLLGVKLQCLPDKHRRCRVAPSNLHRLLCRGGTPVLFHSSSLVGSLIASKQHKINTDFRVRVTGWRPVGPHSCPFVVIEVTGAIAVGHSHWKSTNSGIPPKGTRLDFFPCVHSSIIVAEGSGWFGLSHPPGVTFVGYFS